MKLIDKFIYLLNKLNNKQNLKEREMKSIFQWRRYLEWKDLSYEEKISAKRFLLIPVFAYLLIGIFNNNFSLIILFLIGFVLYKKFEKGRIEKNKFKSR